MEIILKNAVDEFYKKPSLEMVYYEAVSNSIFAGAKNIIINIKIDSFDAPNTLSICIEDDGDGFNDKNFDKFSHLLKKEDKLHKGLGRLVYLKYFDNIQIDSRYENKTRSFVFDNCFNGNSNFLESEEIKPNKTVLYFSQYSLERIKTYDYLRPDYIKEILTLKFFTKLYSFKLRKQDFKITIQLETGVPNSEHNFYDDVQTIDAFDLPELKEEIFVLEGSMFDKLTLQYSILHNEQSKIAGDKSIITAICVDERTIPIDIITKDGLPNGCKIIFILLSDYFIGKVDNTRQELTLESSEIEKIKKVYKDKVADILSAEIPAIVERNEKVNHSLNNTYPHLQGYFDKNSVGLIDRHLALEIANKRFIKAQQEIFEANELTDEQYEKSQELSSRTLTSYILYRSKIIDKLKSINIKSDEADIHNIVLPKRKHIHQSNFMNDLYSNNAWLLDDKFMSYYSILSDYEMSKIISEISLDDESSDQSRPDIALIFSNDINNSEKVDAVIVELKKLGRTLAGKEEIVSQLKQRARKLAFLYPKKIQRIWFYGIVDIDKDFRISLKEEKFIEIFSKGTVFYKEHDTIIDEEKDIRIPYGLFVINYEAFLKDAEVRNDTFLKILKESFSTKA